MFSCMLGPCSVDTCARIYYNPFTGCLVRCCRRSDCQAFRPCHEADPLFAQMVKRAGAAGVKLLAYGVNWRGGAAHLGSVLLNHYSCVFC